MKEGRYISDYNLKQGNHIVIYLDMIEIVIFYNHIGEYRNILVKKDEKIKSLKEIIRK